MRKILAISLLLAFQLFLQSCPGPTPNPQPTVVTQPHQSIKGFVDYLANKSIPHEISSSGFPFRTGEIVFEWKRGFDFQAEKAKNKLTEIYYVVGYLRERGFVNSLTSKSVTENDFEIVKCECNNFMFLVKFDFPINGDDKKLVLTTLNDDFFESVAPNYISYNNYKDNTLVDSTINYHNEQNPYATLHQSTTPPLVSNGFTNYTNANQTIGLLGTGFDVDYNKYTVNISQLTATVNNCYENQFIGFNFSDRTESDLPTPNNNIYDKNGHERHIYGDMALVNAPHWPLILPVKTHDKYGIGTLFSVSCGTVYASNMGVKVINASWGIVHQDSVELRTLRHAIEHAGRKNVIFVNSAGNDGENLNNNKEYKIFPTMFENLPNKVVVSSYDVAKKKEGDLVDKLYQNRGNNFVDVLAVGTTKTKMNNATYVSRGTSFSAGIVSAQIAHIIREQPNGTPYRNILNLFYDDFCTHDDIFAVNNNMSKNGKIFRRDISSTYYYSN